MTMGRIGWFILGYLVLGYVLDVILTLVIVALKKYKDSKEKTDENMNELDDRLAIVDEAAEMENPEYPGAAWFKYWLIGRLTWPVSLPVGLYYLYCTGNEKDGLDQ